MKVSVLAWKELIKQSSLHVFHLRILASASIEVVTRYRNVCHDLIQRLFDNPALDPADIDVRFEHFSPGSIVFEKR